VAGELFHVQSHGQTLTDRHDKANNRPRNFANMPIKSWIITDPILIIYLRNVTKTTKQTLQYIRCLKYTIT
jgi:hypothetical protein